VASVNSLLSRRHLKSRFCTFVYGVLASDGRFTYVNAGHNPPLLVGRDGIRRLGPTGPVLGVFENARFAEQTLELRDGETIVLFSDGVTEARDVTEEEFGEDRLIDCVHSAANKPAAAILDAILSSVRDFAVVPADDMTVVVMMYRSAFEEGS
ncbi:MAG TPA: PP2C family protein-serine/threonine phosphatase, partial [Thermoanaerobaculia bacterium]|nr:PP2C family protein-serine/threonine phosphatase [Thermoanaerobaculia bacterium]